MSRQPVRAETAYLYCSPDTKERIRAAKQGGETFDQVIRQLAVAYDSDNGRKMRTETA